jgi:hypothetical protein
MAPCPTQSGSSPRSPASMPSMTRRPCRPTREKCLRCRRAGTGASVTSSNVIGWTSRRTPSCGTVNRGSDGQSVMEWSETLRVPCTDRCGEPREALPRSSGVCNSVPLHQYYSRKSTTNPVHGSRANVWSSQILAQCSSSNRTPATAVLVRSTNTACQKLRLAVRARSYIR